MNLTNRLFKRLGILWLVVAVLCGVWSCGDSQNSKESELTATAVDSIFVPEYAQGFQIAYYPDRTRLYVLNLEAPGDSGRYDVLAKYDILKTSSDLEHVDKADFTFENTPQTMACLSTTHVAMMEKIGQLAKVKAVCYGERIKSKAVQNAMEQERIQNLTGGQEVDAEKMLAIHPDVFTIYPFGSPQIEKFEAAGIGGVQNLDYLEAHPLGKVEWAIFMGELVGEGQKARNTVSEIVKNYQEIAEQATLFSDQPSVFSGSSYNSIWYAPGGLSAVAKFISDAGGAYIFADKSQAKSLELDVEKLLVNAGEADFFGKVFDTDKTIDASLFHEGDERLKGIRAFSQGGLFYCNAQATDYFGMGVMEPEKILQDLQYIFHGEPKSHTPTYFTLLD